MDSGSARSAGPRTEEPDSFGGRKLYAIGAPPSRILLAHSDLAHRDAVAAALRHDGNLVITARDGGEALERLADCLLERAAPPLPDLIVAELGLPIRRGVDLLADLRHAGWTTPFVLLSRPRDRHLAPAARALGKVTVFESPFALIDLRAAVALLTASDEVAAGAARHDSAGAIPLPEATERDRRSGARVLVDMEVLEHTKGFDVLRHCTDLSRSGMFMTGTSSPLLGSVAPRRFTLPDGSATILTAGKLVRHGTARGRPGFGVEFVHVSGTAQCHLDAFVAHAGTTS